MESKTINNISNSKIASEIQKIADILEIIGENSFKIIAYQRAVRSIEMCTDNLSDIYIKSGIKGLENIPNIGISIAEKIAELLQTGSIKYLQNISSQVPNQVLSFTQIPGVGPKLSKKLYDTFHSANINILSKDLKSDKYLDVFKEKTRANILRGIEILSQQSDRMLLSVAEPIAKDITNIISKYPEVEKVDVVGSLRRMTETIGDIDIVVSQRKIKNSALIKATTDKQKTKLKNNEIIDKFVKEDFVAKVISYGDTKATIIHKKGPQIDLEILQAEEYGSLLQHFTGSKEHNIALRTYAEKQGLSISEHGIKKIQNNKLKLKIIKCQKEEDVYRTLKMQTPSPELRENKGEIEVAIKHQLPKLVELSDVKGDLQMHSTYSDGQNTIMELAISCKKRGYEYMSITDHPSTLGVTHGLKESDIKNYLRDIHEAQRKIGICIFSGIEANIKPNGEIDLPDKFLKQLEFVIASVHSSFYQNKKDATARLVKAIANPYIKMIAHPSGRLINRRPGIDVDWPEIFVACKKYNKILEINSFPDRLDLTDILTKKAIEYGVKLMINTDSHNIHNLENMRYGVAVARRGWATRKDIVNTYPLNQILKVINK